MLSTTSRAWVSLVMFLVQFLAPLGVTMAAYILISYHLWGAGHIGAATQQQQLRRLASRRRTIKMLVLVVILFGVSWLPLNLYHLISDWSRYKAPTYIRSRLSRIFAGTILSLCIPPSLSSLAIFSPCQM